MAFNLLMLGPAGRRERDQSERFAKSRSTRVSDRLHPPGRGAHEAANRAAWAKAIMDRCELVRLHVMIGIVRRAAGAARCAGRLRPPTFPRTVGAGAALDGIMADRDALIVVESSLP